MESGLTKQRIIAELVRSPHGALGEYAPITKQAVAQDAEFFAHLVAWNEKNGQVRDAKIALPVLSLQEGYEFAENSLAHLALLDPRNFVRAVQFAKEPGNVGKRGGRNAIGRLVQRYLRYRERNVNYWTRTVVQHRASMKWLYSRYHVRPEALYDAILFKGIRPPGSIFEAVANLSKMPPTAAAAAIQEHRIPFLVAMSAMGKRMQDTDVLHAIIQRMTPSELVTNMKLLEKLGVRNQAATRGALEEGLAKLATSKKVSLKTTVAASQVGDEVLKQRLHAVQDKQLQSFAAEGNWLVLGDKSGSMSASIEAARVIAGTLAKMVKGEVHLIFFNDMPQYMNVSGKSYEEVIALTKNVKANGGTSVGCGMRYAIERKLDINGIAVVSDGGENAMPVFAQVYTEYCKKFDTSPPVYFYLTSGSDRDVFSHNMRVSGHELQIFDLRHNLDYYSLPNLIATMRASRYSLIDDIMAVPLLTLDEVFNDKDREIDKENQHAA